MELIRRDWSPKTWLNPKYVTSGCHTYKSITSWLHAMIIHGIRRALSLQFQAYRNLYPSVCHSGMYRKSIKFNQKWLKLGPQCHCLCMPTSKSLISHWLISFKICWAHYLPSLPSPFLPSRCFVITSDLCWSGDMNTRVAIYRLGAHYQPLVSCFTNKAHSDLFITRRYSAKAVCESSLKMPHRNENAQNTVYVRHFRFSKLRPK